MQTTALPLSEKVQIYALPAQQRGVLPVRTTNEPFVVLTGSNCSVMFEESKAGLKKRMVNWQQQLERIMHLYACMETTSRRHEDKTPVWLRWTLRTINRRYYYIRWSQSSWQFKESDRLRQLVSHTQLRPAGQLRKRLAVRWSNVHCELQMMLFKKKNNEKDIKMSNMSPWRQNK